ncbi:MAG: phytanoyl-CoA dioxygenase family protein [Longimicrobiaceae bacterium]
MKADGSAAGLADLDACGYALVPDVVSGDGVRRLLGALEEADGAEGVRRRESVYAIRNLLEAVPAVAELARSPEVRALVEPVLGTGAFAVRGILFDKTPDANWKVAWHQDLTIAVRERREVAGFGPWSEKAGVVHVQPPAAVLERMVTVRLHLDPCGPENGPVQVIPGSHRAGRLSADEVQRWRAERAPEAACIGVGGVLLMRPLLLHASSPSTLPAHRRVIHLEFAADDLPGGLEWHGRW